MVVNCNGADGVKVILWVASSYAAEPLMFVVPALRVKVMLAGSSDRSKVIVGRTPSATPVLVFAGLTPVTRGGVGAGWVRENATSTQ